MTVLSAEDTPRGRGDSALSAVKRLGYFFERSTVRLQSSSRKVVPESVTAH